MKKPNRIFLIISAVLFVLLITLQHFGPKPTDWSPNFTAKSKTPYGCLVGYEMLHDIFPGKKVASNRHSFYAQKELETSRSKNLIILTDNFNPDKLDLESLLTFVERGNSVFISALFFSDSFADTLHFKLDYHTNIKESVTKRKDSCFFSSPVLQNKQKYVFNKPLNSSEFARFDSSKSTILGYNSDKKVNFLSIPFGKGTVLVHCQPLVFTNYHLLYSNHEYAAAALSHLPVSDTWWDNYYKPGRLVNTSPVRFILSQPALQAAYYLIVITLLFYLIFEGKRRQRVIPIITPLQNTSLNFIQTLGKLYFKNQDHADIAKKKALYFKDYLRERYHIRASLSDQSSLELLTAKSGISEEKIKNIISRYTRIKQESRLTAQELFDFNKKIEDFYKNCI